MGVSTSRPNYNSNKFKKILDHFTDKAQMLSCIESRLEGFDLQVEEALRKEGLESCNLIIGVDFTKSNEWTGKHSFGGRCLHSLGLDTVNPYEDAIQIIANTLKSFDDDNLIPCYGFGDFESRDITVFSFNPNDEPCRGADTAVSRYREIAQSIGKPNGLILAGPTSFAPLIRKAMDIVVKEKFRYHVLLIIADGQVTPPQVPETVKAIVDASSLPLSIVMVGVGDGPWENMEAFDDEIPERSFDNFQFVNLTALSKKMGIDPQKREAQFALSALMECPFQYKIIQNLNLMQHDRSNVRNVRAPQVLSPPAASYRALDNMKSQVGAIGYGGPQSYQPVAQPPPAYSEQMVCPITKQPFRDPVIAADGALRFFKLNCTGTRMSAQQY